MGMPAKSPTKAKRAKKTPAKRAKTAKSPPANSAKRAKRRVQAGSRAVASPAKASARPAGRAYAKAEPMRRRKATPKELDAQHAHEDPRAYAGVIQDSQRAPEAQNFGQFKNRAVARMDKPTNWFRRGRGR